MNIISRKNVDQLRLILGEKPKNLPQCNVDANHSFRSLAKSPNIDWYYQYFTIKK